MTYSNCLTEDGKLTVYASEGRFTEDPSRMPSSAAAAWRKSTICRIS